MSPSSIQNVMLTLCAIALGGEGQIRRQRILFFLCEMEGFPELNTFYMREPHDARKRDFCKYICVCKCFFFWCWLGGNEALG